MYSFYRKLLGVAEFVKLNFLDDDADKILCRILALFSSNALSVTFRLMERIVGVYSTEESFLYVLYGTSYAG